MISRVFLFQFYIILTPTLQQYKAKGKIFVNFFFLQGLK